MEQSENKRIYISIGDKVLTAEAWSREPECDVSGRTIRDRYNDGIRGEALLKKYTSFKDLSHKYQSRIQTFKEWSIEFDITLETLWKRFRRGDRGERLFREIRKKKLA